VKTLIVRTIKKKRSLKIFFGENYACYWEKFLQRLIGQQSAKEALNQQKLYTILLAWL